MAKSNNSIGTSVFSSSSLTPTLYSLDITVLFLKELKVEIKNGIQLFKGGGVYLNYRDSCSEVLTNLLKPMRTARKE